MMCNLGAIGLICLYFRGNEMEKIGTGARDASMGSLGSDSVVGVSWVWRVSFSTHLY